MGSTEAKNMKRYYVATSSYAAILLRPFDGDSAFEACRDNGNIAIAMVAAHCHPLLITIPNIHWSGICSTNQIRQHAVSRTVF